MNIRRIRIRMNFIPNLRNDCRSRPCITFFFLRREAPKKEIQEIHPAPLRPIIWFTGVLESGLEMILLVKSAYLQDNRLEEYIFRLNNIENLKEFRSREPEYKLSYRNLWKWHELWIWQLQSCRCSFASRHFGDLFWGHMHMLIWLAKETAAILDLIINIQIHVSGSCAHGSAYIRWPLRMCNVIVNIL